MNAYSDGFEGIKQALLFLVVIHWDGSTMHQTAAFPRQTLIGVGV
jgi:hypothetical protein